MKIQNGVNEKSKMFFYNGNNKSSIYFSALSAGHFYCDADYRVERNSFKSILLAYIAKGKLTFVNGKKENTAYENELAVIDCFEHHIYYTDDCLETYWVHINGSNTRQIYSEICAKNGCVIACNDIIERRIKDLYNTIKNKISKSDAEISRDIYLLLTDLLVSGETQNDNIIDEAVKFINENFERKLTVDEIARQVHLSSSQFSRKFKQKTGVSPYEYMQSIRLARAKELLKNTPLSISEIAYRTGFQSDSNFISFFKMRENISPLKFRNTMF